MMMGVILAAALCGQASAKPAAPAQAPARSVLGADAKGVPKAKPKAIAIPAKKGSSKAEENARLIAKRRSKKNAAYVTRTNREAAEDQAAIAAAKESQARFERTLPARLEMNRQAILAQDVANRGAFLNRAAGAMERSAGYVYPGQSPTQGTFPTYTNVPVVLPVP